MSRVKLIWDAADSLSNLHIFQERPNREEREKRFSTILPRGHHLSKTSAAVLPQIHTIRRTGASMDECWSLAYLPSDPVPTISLLSVFKGGDPRKLPRLPRPLLPAWFGQREAQARDWRVDWKEKPGVHFHPILYFRPSLPHSAQLLNFPRNQIPRDSAGS